VLDTIRSTETGAVLKILTFVAYAKCWDARVGLEHAQYWNRQRLVDNHGIRTTTHQVKGPLRPYPQGSGQHTGKVQKCLPCGFGGHYRHQLP
jgi:hypothetical protein